MTDLELHLNGETMWVLPERALYWARQSALLLADTHWGKADAFRAGGIPVPGSLIEADLARLDAALHRTQAARLFVLGDLLHARTGRTPATTAIVKEWRARWQHLNITLVRGNHDRGAGDPPEVWRFDCVDAPHHVAPFDLVHQCAGSESAYTLSGHIHPGVRLRGAGAQEFTLPCLLVGTRGAVLPAFGSFTGLGVVSPTRDDHVFVFADDEVIKL